VAVTFKGDNNAYWLVRSGFLDTTTEIEVGYGLAQKYWGLGIGN